MSQCEESKRRLQRVSETIEGFETPYGMELLASIHWVAVRETPGIRDAEGAVTAIQDWSERKRRMFRPEHVRIAWERLRETRWLS